jgi:hypothetical protein
LTGYREVTRWALRKSGVEEWLVSAVMAMYEGANTVVRTDDGDSESFAVKVGLHQGSVLSLLLFIVVMDVITKEIRVGLHWAVLYAVDFVLIATSREEMKDKIIRCKATMEAKGLKVNIGTSTEKAKGIWLGADHFSAQYRTKPLDLTTQRAAKL